jgi:transposase
MEDTELYTKLLGIKRPWFIKEVTYGESPERIDVYLEHEPGMLLPCPECDRHSSVYDHMKERQWQHLNTCHVATFIHARLPRIKCKIHGVKTIISEWAEPGSDMTMAFESHLIALEQECSIQGIFRLTSVSWDRCWGVMERAVRRGLSRKGKAIPEQIGVDEKSFTRGHRYETLVCDIKKGTIEYVADDRKQESLEEYYDRFSKEELRKVEAVAMDMWDPYIAATKAKVPEAERKIVFDKFHVMRLMGEAVDKVRKQEHKELAEQDIEWLKGTKYLWLYSKENLPERRRHEFKTLRKMDLKVSRAWAIKENLRNLWQYSRMGWATRFFKKWYFWATHSRLDPIIKVAKTMKRHIDNILTYLKHRITNSLSEALNGQIEKIKRMACGYRNREHYRTAIYFHCGGLDLYPRMKPQHVGGTHSRAG